MPEFLGRELLLTWKGQAAGAVREKSVAINGEVIDVTSDDSSGWRTLLTKHGVRSLDLGLSGVTKNRNLLADMLSADPSGAVVLTYPDGATISCSAVMANYNDTGPYEDATTYESQMQSSGTVTYSPGAAPTNVVKPAIAGVASVGQTLTALEGEWTKAASYTYQWKADGTNITGATSRTYEVETSDIGAEISVEVTAVNSTGSTAAESAALAAIPS